MIKLIPVYDIISYYACIILKMQFPSVFDHYKFTIKKYYFFLLIVKTSIFQIILKVQYFIHTYSKFSIIH